MADKTVNQGLIDTVKELKETNKRMAAASDALAMNSKVGKKIGDAVKDNAKKSTEGLNSFIGQLESMPVFGAISGIGKALAGSALNAVMEKRRLAKEDALIAKQLGITKEQVAERRKTQELQKAEEANAAKLMDVAKALGYAAEELQVDRGNVSVKPSAADTEARREEARAQDERNQGLINAVKGIDVGSEDKDDKPSWLSLLTGGLGTFAASLHALPGKILGGLVTLGKTMLGGLIKLGTTLIMGLGNRLGRLGRSFGRGLRNLPKAMGKLPAFAKSVGGAVTRGASAAGGLVKGGLRAATGALRFAGPIGLAVTAGMGLFDGISAGIEEFKKSGKVGAAVKEGFAGTLSGLTFGLVSQESISKGFDAIGDFAVKTVDGLKNAASAGFDKAKELTNLGVAKFEELTGLTVPTNLTEVKDAVGKGLTAAAEGFNNLTGLNIPTNLTELKDGLKGTFDSIGNSFTSLTGIEVPTFDDLQTKVSDFANNMKNKISEGWASITSTVGGWWDKAKSAVGLGDEAENMNAMEIRKEIQAAEDRIARSESGENVYYGRDSKGIEKDQAKIAELNKKMQLSLAAAEDGGTMDTSGIPMDAYPLELRDGGNGKYYFYRRLGQGNYRIADDQKKAEQQYNLAMQNSGGFKKLDAMGNATSENQSLQRQQQGSGTTVVNAPNNSSTNVQSGGGGGASVPIPVSDNSSARMAAAANEY